MAAEVTDLTAKLQAAAAKAGAAPARQLLTDDGSPITDPLAYASDRLLGRGAEPRLTRVIQRGRREPTYDLELADGALIEVGPMGKLKDPRHVEDVVATAIGWMPELPSRPKFRTVVNCLLAVAELEDTGVTPEATTRGWVGRFADRAGAKLYDVATADGRADLFKVFDGKGPDVFRATDACLYVHLPAMSEVLTGQLRIAGASPRELGARLQRIGFTQRLIEAPRDADGHKAGRRRYWQSPANFDPDDEAHDGPSNDD